MAAVVVAQVSQAAQVAARPEMPRMDKGLVGAVARRGRGLQVYILSLTPGAAAAAEPHRAEYLARVMARPQAADAAVYPEMAATEFTVIYPGRLQPTAAAAAHLALPVESAAVAEQAPMAQLTQAAVEAQQQQAL